MFVSSTFDKTDASAFNQDVCCQVDDVRKRHSGSRDCHVYNVIFNLPATARVQTIVNFYRNLIAAG